MKEILLKINKREVKAKIFKRSKKNIILRLVDGEIHISIPKYSPYRVGEGFLKSREPWIEEVLKKQDKISKSLEKDEVYYIGEKYIILEEKGIKGVKVDREYLRVEKNGKDILRQVLSDEFKDLILERYEYYSRLSGLRAKKLRVKALKSAWGICYSSKTITLNYLLIGAPKEVIDYVIVHELCHLKHMNHSKEFWSLVNSTYGDYTNAKIWLKKNGAKLYNNPLIKD